MSLPATAMVLAVDVLSSLSLTMSTERKSAPTVTALKVRVATVRRPVVPQLLVGVNPHTPTMRTLKEGK